MSKSLKDLAQIFSEILSNNLNTFDQLEHSIDFVNEKTSRSDCVYNILQDELIALRNYIVNALKKN